MTAEATRTPTAQYMLPGIRVREYRTTVPLDWHTPDGETIELFVRELVDPASDTAERPLLTYLQGGPGGANPRPLGRDGWIDEALRDYRVVLVDQRGTGGSTPVDAEIVAERGDTGGEFLACFRADSIVRDLEHVRTSLYDGRRWATLAQSFGGWITMTYLSFAPEGLTASYVCGGVPGMPPRASEVYRRTFDRVEAKTAEFYRRYPDDEAAVARIADRLAAGDVRLPDGDVLTVRRWQSLGIDFGMKPGFERLHWLVEKAFIENDRLSPAFLQDVMTLSSSAGNPLFWTLQESIYGDEHSGPTAWAAQAEREQRAQFDETRRPLLFTGEMAFSWMFDEVRLLRGFRTAVDQLAAKTDWSPLYDRAALQSNEVPVAAVVYFDDMYVDAGLQLETLKGVGNSQYWVTNEYEHDGIGSGRTLTRLRELVRDRGGERA
ncbi:alpha/beta fold hydrolase [Microbacterium hydrocarbonoxydans]|uniref:Prolyl aminopeptidase 2. Serine peptidase. MEROPS family S33 n=1 Tax=Microbacterium hydrocarbonoxydans TaxID=273678 RepID=A0A1H4IRU4_9MICO|nr:alpha/beta fold hydrolase [Microbacterium hydrocarbonoxydans]SEB35942.1 prolyl aminopeptidase 2. Serine peptidase. MEROPS family S33 [Microbacterium hydrocarbonoxydans]